MIQNHDAGAPAKLILFQICIEVPL